jgi:hypothetical protein
MMKLQRARTINGAAPIFHSAAHFSPELTPFPRARRSRRPIALLNAGRVHSVVA